MKRKELTARPTAPNPKTATVEPFLGFATFSVEPNPMEYKTINYCLRVM